MPLFLLQDFDVKPHDFHRSGQISTSPKPELGEYWGDSLTKPPFKVTSAEVALKLLTIDPDVEVPLLKVQLYMFSFKWPLAILYLNVQKEIYTNILVVTGNSGNESKV